MDDEIRPVLTRHGKENWPAKKPVFFTREESRALRVQQSQPPLFKFLFSGKNFLKNFLDPDMKVKVVCRKIYDYVRYDLKEIAFPSSLPDPPHIKKRRKLTLAERFLVCYSLVLSIQFDLKLVDFNIWVFIYFLLRVRWEA